MLGTTCTYWADHKVLRFATKGDHTDVDTGLTQGGKDLTGNAGTEGHAVTNCGHNGDLIQNRNIIRL